MLQATGRLLILEAKSRQIRWERVGTEVEGDVNWRNPLAMVGFVCRCRRRDLRLAPTAPSLIATLSRFIAAAL